MEKSRTINYKVTLLILSVLIIINIMRPPKEVSAVTTKHTIVINNEAFTGARYDALGTAQGLTLALNQSLNTHQSFYLGYLLYKYLDNQKAFQIDGSLYMDNNIPQLLYDFLQTDTWKNIKSVIPPIATISGKSELNPNVTFLMYTSSFIRHSRRHNGPGYIISKGVNNSRPNKVKRFKILYNPDKQGYYFNIGLLTTNTETIKEFSLDAQLASLNLTPQNNEPVYINILSTYNNSYSCEIGVQILDEDLNTISTNATLYSWNQSPTISEYSTVGTQFFIGANKYIEPMNNTKTYTSLTAPTIPTNLTLTTISSNLFQIYNYGTYAKAPIGYSDYLEYTNSNNDGKIINETKLEPELVHDPIIYEGNTPPEPPPPSYQPIQPIDEVPYPDEINTSLPTLPTEPGEEATVIDWVKAIANLLKDMVLAVVNMPTTIENTYNWLRYSLAIIPNTLGRIYEFLNEDLPTLVSKVNITHTLNSVGTSITSALNAAGSSLTSIVNFLNIDLPNLIPTGGGGGGSSTTDGLITTIENIGQVLSSMMDNIGDITESFPQAIEDLVDKVANLPTTISNAIQGSLEPDPENENHINILSLFTNLFQIMINLIKLLGAVLLYITSIRNIPADSSLFPDLVQRGITFTKNIQFPFFEMSLYTIVLYTLFTISTFKVVKILRKGIIRELG